MKRPLAVGKRRAGMKTHYRVALVVYHSTWPAAMPCRKVMRITFVIHDTPQQSEFTTRDWQRPSARFADVGRGQTVPHRYIFVPDPLIAAFAHDPLAVGVYVAIARLTFAAKGAVSVAARELCAWVGSDRAADRAAMMRRIVKLEERGWLVVTRTPAAKHSLLPTWGRDNGGCARPWRFEKADSGRPSHLRGRRVPLALLDDYIGRLDPQPGHGRALICRYFTRPLIDLVDIGTYAIGLRAEIAPTPRLQYLGLCHEKLMQTPAGLPVLLQQAQAGGLATLVNDVRVLVTLSIQGCARLNLELPLQVQNEALAGAQGSGSVSGSVDGSTGGSSTKRHEYHHSRDADGQNVRRDSAAPLIARDVRMGNQKINHDSSDRNYVGLVGGDITRDQTVGEQPERPLNYSGQHRSIFDDAGTRLGQSLARDVAEGHRMLNPNRPILLGEWYELLELQVAHSAEQMLVWQARAHRATTPRLSGIGPAYYRACATHVARDCSAPSQQRQQPPLSNRASTLASPPLDPERDALLRKMGVRARHQIADVPLEVISAWHNALAHPDFTTQFASPVGFAVAQMRLGLLPPSSDELGQWAVRTRQKTDRYHSERHIATTTISGDSLAAEQELEARVRRIAPPDADVEMLCEIARLLEAGATDAAIRAHL